MATQQGGNDYRCFATGALVIATTDERAFKVKVRLHKKVCPTCAKYDDGKCHRFTHQYADSNGRMFIEHYRDGNYENGTPANLNPPTNSSGAFEGGMASNGRDTFGVSILSEDSVETTLTDERIASLNRIHGGNRGRGGRKKKK